MAQPVDPPSHALFKNPGSIPPGVAAPRANEIVRSRLVDIDAGPLASMRAPRGPKVPFETHLILRLFDDVTLRATLLSAVAVGNGGMVFEGEVDGEQMSSVTIAVGNGQFYGNVKVKDRWYRVQYAGSGLHAVAEINEAVFPPELDPPSAASGQHAAAAELPASEVGPTIDVLVVWTPNAQTAVGGSTAMSNLVNTAIAETNTAYQNSGVNQRLRLVHAENIGASVDSSFSTALSQLANPGDGVMDSVHAMRDTWGADEVVLIIDNASSCGIGYIIGPSPGDSFDSYYGFAVVHHSCATGYYSFGHELGHNMGLDHDRATVGGASGGWNPYSLGWNDPLGAFRTIMAYNHTGEPRVQYFSTPLLTYGGTGRALGSAIGNVDEAYNAQTLNNSAAHVAAYRATVVPSGPSAPTSVEAHATTSTQVVVSWPTVTGATSYNVYRRAAGSVTYNSIGSSATTSYTDNSATAKNAYLYRVRAVNSDGSSTDSPSDLATTVVPTNNPLAAGTTSIKAVHLTELRDSVDAVQTLAGVTTTTYTNSVLSGVAVKAVHITELRTRLDAALTTLSITTSAYTNTVAAGGKVKAADFQDIRDRVK
jgi:hypothetical protein